MENRQDIEWIRIGEAARMMIEAGVGIGRRGNISHTRDSVRRAAVSNLLSHKIVGGTRYYVAKDEVEKFIRVESTMMTITEVAKRLCIPRGGVYNFVLQGCPKEEVFGKIYLHWDTFVQWYREQPNHARKRELPGVWKREEK